jgi:molecular chaperone HtpG
MTQPSEEPKPATHKFQAEVNQILHLVIHSLYSHKEIFLRELISNASDALDKLRFRAITEPDLMADDPTLEIRITPDSEKGTLTIEDTGIGMSEETLVRDLGTVAHSGSRAFLEQLAERGQKDVSLIGQFGVGFYSAYLVADRVEAVSLPAGKDATAHRWASDAKDTFTVEPAERTKRGTSVTLHVKEDQKEFLQAWRLRELVTRYSDYVSHPIKLSVTTKTGEGADAKTETSLESINRASALWQRPKSEITEAQYEEFYRHLAHAYEPPLARVHFKVEGAQEFAALLFIPKHPPYDLVSNQKTRGVRLFVKRVLVMENCEDLLPEWLRFVRGVVDSDDLPLNVSREILQDSSAVRTIKKQLVKNLLDKLDSIAEEKKEDYLEFWKGFGVFMKEGLALDPETKDRIAKLVRYETSRDEGLTSLAEYVARMPHGQEAIYFILGDSMKFVSSSPHLEELRKRGYEVLYMTHPVDEWATDALHEFDGKPLVSVMRADLKLTPNEEEKKDKEEKGVALKPLLDEMKNVLKDAVKDVRVSDRLTDSPVCLVLDGPGPHAYVNRLMQQRGGGLPRPKRVLEVNPTHPIIVGLSTLRERAGEADRVHEWIELLYDQALITEGSALDDPNRFVKRVSDLLTLATGSAAAAVPAVTPR